MTAFILKLIASASMFIDHAGLLLFNDNPIMRIIGRLAFPIFAYFIAEGFKYTKNRGRYFLRVFILGVLCQIVYTVVDGSLYLGILIAFSISIALMYLLDCLKAAIRGEKSDLLARTHKLLGGRAEVSNKADIAICALVFVLAVGGTYLLCDNVAVDYEFFGIMLPVAVSLFSKKWPRLAVFSLVLILLCIDVGTYYQRWSLLAILLLAVYNGNPGKYRMKYFFYIFYPAHLVLLYAVDLLR